MDPYWIITDEHPKKLYSLPSDIINEKSDLFLAPRDTEKSIQDIVDLTPLPRPLPSQMENLLPSVTTNSKNLWVAGEGVASLLYGIQFAESSCYTGKEVANNIIKMHKNLPKRKNNKED